MHRERAVSRTAPQSSMPWRRSRTPVSSSACSRRTASSSQQRRKSRESCSTCPARRAEATAVAARRSSYSTRAPPSLLLIIWPFVHPFFALNVRRNVISGVAGITADANSLVNYARQAAQRHLFSYNEDIPVELLAQRLCDLKQGYTQYGGAPFPAHILDPFSPLLFCQY